MAVTSSFGLLPGVPITAPLLANPTSRPDVVGFADGSFVLAVTRDDVTDHVELQRFTAAGEADGTPVILAGVNPAISKLPDGTVVIATENGSGDVLYSILPPSGPPLLDLNIGENDTTAPAIAGLSNGTFVVVTQDNFSATDNDIEVVIRNADGTSPGLDFPIDTTLADDRNPSVAALTGGGFAVAWERHVGGETEIWTAVYDNNGSVVQAPTLLDTDGAVNRNVAVTALASGGFALAYEQSGGASLDLAVRTFTATGAPVTNFTLGGGASTEQGADIAEIAPNILAISQEGDFGGPTNTNALVAVADLSGPSIIGQPGVNVTAGNDSNTAIAVTAPGKFVAFTEHVDGTVSGEMVTMARTSTGDDADDTIVGEALTDRMFGGGGSDDLQVFDGHVVAGETYDGGTGADFLTIFGAGTSTFDFRSATVTDIEQLYFASFEGGGATTRFVASQFPFTSVFFEPQGTGARVVSITMGTQAILNLSGIAIEGTPGNGDGFAVEGDGDAETITGTALRDQLVGNGGNDILNGGLGADLLFGGANNDRYLIDDLGDVADETGGGGNDRVESTVSVDLTDTNRFKGDIEQVTLLGAAALDVLGNGLANVIVGNAGANRLDGLGGADTLRGRGGGDTYVVDNAGDVVDESLAGSGGIDTVEATDLSIDLTDTARFKGDIENVLVFGFDTISITGNGLANELTGNDGSNQLFGGGADDRLDGGLGDDVMDGGAGNDTFIVGDELDQVIDSALTGLDTVLVNLFAIEDVTTWTLGAGQRVEVLNVTTFFSTTSTQNIVGNEFAQTINGNGGKNELSGGGGADILNGFGGDDVLLGEDGDDVVNGGEGADFLDGGETGNDRLFGGAHDDQLDGLSGNDILDGGTGADIMLGQGGNDTFFVDDLGDDPREEANDGFDTVKTSISYTLAGTTEIERLETTDAAGTGAIDLTGNGFGQRLVGNAGANRLDGKGGRDALQGLGGDDTYYVDNAGDGVIEAAGGGTDTVYASVSYTLRESSASTPVEVEVLRALYSGATGITLTGNGLAQTIVGGGAGDVLAGRGGVDRLLGQGGDDRLDGGLGIDRLEGGAGNDVLTDLLGGDVLIGGADNDSYRFSTVAGTIVEAAGAPGGIDTVFIAATYTLGANLENLFLTGVGAFDGTGNGEANRLVGNGAQNTLTGLGGNDLLQGGLRDDVLLGGADDDTLQGEHGNDTLDGGAGRDRVDGGIGHDSLTGGTEADTFIFSGAFGLDTITDFQDSGAETSSDGLDRMDLRGMRAANGGAALTLADLLITQAGANTLIRLDLDNNGVEDQRDYDGNGTFEVARITLLATTAGNLNAFDFVF